MEAIVGERIRLANERIDHMTKVNVGLVFPNQTRHRELMLTSVPYLDFIGIDADLDSASNETTRDGIPILFDGDDRIARDHTFMLGVDRKKLRRKIR